MSAGGRQLLHLCKTIPLPHLRQGCTLSIRCPSNIPLPRFFNIKLLPEWRDDAQLSLKQTLPFPSPLSSPSHKGKLQVEEEHVVDVNVTNKTHEEGKMTSMGRVESHVLIDIDWKKYGLCQDMLLVKKKEDESSQFLNDGSDDEEEEEEETTVVVELEAKVPEKCNVTCHLQSGGNIFVPKGKIEGDVDFYTNNGSISVKKLRGHHISLSASFEGKKEEEEEEGGGGGRRRRNSNDGGGIIHVTQLIEAKDVNLTANRRIRAKMINGSNVNVDINLNNKEETDDDDYDYESINPLDEDDGLALIDIGSLYASSSSSSGNANGARLSVTHLPNTNNNNNNRSKRRKRKGSDVRIKSHHGHVSVRTTSISQRENDVSSLDEFGNRIPLIDLGGVNGSCDIGVEQDQQSVDELEEEKEKEGNTNCKTEPTTATTNVLAARVHIDSLSPESISLVTSNVDSGDIQLTVDRKVESDLRLLSCCPTSLLNDLDVDLFLSENEEEVEDALKDLMEQHSGKHCKNAAADDDDDDITSKSKISIQTQAFTTTNEMLSSSLTNNSSNTVEYIEGYIENKSHEPDSRFDVRNSVSVGKIRMEGAASQALKGFSGSGSRESRSDGGGSSSSSSSKNDLKLPERPLLAVAASNQISLETVSWFGAIARRYGLEDGGGRELGRQAKAGGAKSRRREKFDQ